MSSISSIKFWRNEANANSNIVKAPELAPVPEKMMVTNALKPDVFQEFPLKEKTVLSHNVAM